MAPRRRLSIFTFVAAVFIISLYRLYYTVSPPPLRTARPQPGSKIPSPTPVVPVDWATIPHEYPLTSFIPLPTGSPRSIPKIQHEFSFETATDRSIRLKRQEVVKAVFQRSWSAYRQKAWRLDEVRPVTGGFVVSFGGWGATLVDSLDTLYIMGLQDEFKEAVSAASTINFGKSAQVSVNVFETTIRYLGGFLSAYDLSHDPILLTKAIEIGTMLYKAFDTPNHMHITRWNWQRAADGFKQETPTSVLLSEIGSLSLEFTRLSQLTNDPKWYDAIARITDLLELHQNATKLPGMWPVSINSKDMTMTSDATFTLGSMSDSAYEYLPKTYLLLNGLVPQYRGLYTGAMSTATKHTFFHPMIPTEADILFSGTVQAAAGPNGAMLNPQVQHLTSFAGGMLALGSKIFDIPSHLSLARKLVDGCIWSYNTVPLGMMPESFRVVPCPKVPPSLASLASPEDILLSTSPCAYNETIYHASLMIQNAHPVNATASSVIASRRLPPGITSISDARYILRPEAIESIFILYRITGDKSLVEDAWRMFSAIQAATVAEFGNSGIIDVTATTDGSEVKLNDSQESFWLAETLKYFYLIFSEPGLISLDEFVFNTEAHPLRWRKELNRTDQEV